MNILIEKYTKSTKANEDIKIISWNLDLDNNNITQKIGEILSKNADIIMLQECVDNIDIFFNDYISYGKAQSHCGIINLFIHKKLKPELINKYIDNGMVLYHINSKHGQLILGSVHLPPYGGINDKILRTITIFKLINYLKIEKLLDLPIIIGGDTNMRDDEQIKELTDNILDDIYENYGDENKYHTWPNKTSIYKDKFEKYKTFRFDRFFYSNITTKTFNTILSENSDHLMIETKIQFKKLIYNTINIKFEKMIRESKRYPNIIYDDEPIIQYDIVCI
jgi:hypothetical protein